MYPWYYQNHHRANKFFFLLVAYFKGILKTLSLFNIQSSIQHIKEPMWGPFILTHDFSTFNRVLLRTVIQATKL